MKGDPTIAELEHMRETRFERQRAGIEKRLIHFAESIREAEAQGAEGRAVLKELRTLRAFFLRDAEKLGFEIRLHENSTNIAKLRPLAEHGAKFPGSKPDRIGKVRRFIRAYKKARPNAGAAEVWAAIKAEPPKGITVLENRLGKYIETDGAPDTGYARFANLVAEERPK